MANSAGHCSIALPGRTIKSTPQNPAPTASHLGLLTCSRSSQTASKVTSSGETKLMALTSAIGRKRSALKLNSVEPISNMARMNWPPGCAVRISFMPMRGASRITISSVCTV